MHEVRLRIRWRDIDNYGHVNNAVYLNYLEECRDRMVEYLFGPEAWDFVSAHVGIDFRNELTQADGEVVVRCEVVGYGRSSLRTRERIEKTDGTLAAEAESVIVPRSPHEPSKQGLSPMENEPCCSARSMRRTLEGIVSPLAGCDDRARSGRGTSRCPPT